MKSGINCSFIDEIVIYNGKITGGIKMKKIKIGTYLDSYFQVGLIEYVLVRVDTNEYFSRSREWTKDFYKARRFHRKSDAASSRNCMQIKKKVRDLIKVKEIYLDVWRLSNNEVQGL